MYIRATQKSIKWFEWGPSELGWSGEGVLQLGKQQRGSSPGQVTQELSVRSLQEQLGWEEVSYNALGFPSQWVRGFNFLNWS